MSTVAGDHAALDKLIRPRSIAIIGASDRATEMAGYPLANLTSYGYPGAIYPVNPRHDVIAGHRCYPDVAALPEAPDTALVAVPARRVVDVLRQCHARGITTATVLSSGFGEGDGDPAAVTRAAEIVELAAATGMRVLGPNCIGVMNLEDRTIARAAAFLPTNLVAGPVALISQSGGASLVTTNRAQSRGVGLNLVLPTGNELDVDMAELFEYAVAQPSTRVVCLFVESVRDGARFMAAAATARERGVHVVAAKVGRSDTGAVSVSAHTGALAGSDAAYDAAFRRAGIRRVTGYDGLHEVADVLLRHGPLTGRRLGAVCISGAEAASIADDCARLRIPLPAPTAATRDDLAGALAYGAVRNPLDLTGQLFSGDRDLARAALAAVGRDPSFDAILVAVTTLGPNVARWLGPLLLEAQQTAGKPVLVSWWTADARTLEAHAHLRALGLTVFDSTHHALEAVAAAAPAPQPERRPAGSATTAGSVHTGSAATALLDGIVPFVAAEPVASAAEAVAALKRLGRPVVLKDATPGLAHKSESGGVAVDLRTPAAVADAYARMAPAAVTVEPMEHGLEVLVGVRRDPAFGPTISLALGGIWTELLGDVVTELCPVDPHTATDMIRRLRAAPLFEGFRGGPRHDAAALAGTLVAMSRWAVAHPEVAAAEINPVIVRPDGGGVVAVDALVED